MLVKSGLVEADKAGLNTIVMSLPAGRAVYERQGFKHISTIDEDDSEFGGNGHHINHFLVREAQASL